MQNPMSEDMRIHECQMQVLGEKKDNFMEVFTDHYIGTFVVEKDMSNKIRKLFIAV